MQRKILIGILLILLSVGVKAQIDSISIRLAGIIYGEDTVQNGSFVHVVNLRTGRGVISDSLGYFKTVLLKADTLLFGCLGYEDKLFVLPDTLSSTVLFVEIRLTEKSYYLDVVDILALSRENQFNYDFKTMPLLDNQWGQQLIIPGVTKDKYVWVHKEEKLYGHKTYTGPFSLIYNTFSDEAKSLKKYAELLRNEEGDMLIDEKFNMQLLSDYTGFKGDTLIDFNLYLNFSRSYLLNTDGYHILLNVKNKLPAFKAEYLCDSIQP